MKRIALTICSATLLLISCNNADDKAKTETPPADNKEKMTEVKTPAGPPDSAAMATMQKAYEDFAKPGEMHKWMEKINGTWEAEMTQYMDPVTPKSKGTIVQKSVMNGLYVTSTFSSTSMGKPFEGMSTMGYDNVKKQFVNTWIDNVGSGIVYMMGTYDAVTKILNLKGKMSDPTTGGDANLREEMKIIDDNTYSLTMYGTGQDGKESKFMEGTFKKKK